MELQTVIDLMFNAHPEALPLLGVAGIWLWNGAQDGHQAAHCVDACVTMHYALAEFGIDSRVEAVVLDVEGAASRTLYGGDGPRYNANGTFNGHTLLVVPEAGRLLDATVQQYREVPDTDQATLPILAALPERTSLGTAHIQIPRGDHQVTYRPLPPLQREAWRSPAVVARDRDYREAAANLAGNTFDLMRTGPLRDKLTSAPYPRLHRLLEVLGDAQSIADERGYRFRHPKTGREVRLSEVA